MNASYRNPPSVHLKSWRQYNLGPFVLGTAQLGLPYGVANKLGQPSDTRAREILSQAWARGIRVFDTARDYGTSEQILGTSLQQLGVSEQALIITKFPRETFRDQQTLFSAVDDSLALLHSQQVFAVLAHSAEILRNAETASKMLLALKESGKATFTGVSVYSVDDARLALKSEHFDIIQMPLNVLDRRPIAACLAASALERNKLLLFRSAFLQGLLLMDPEGDLPEKVGFARSELRKWWQVCQDSQVAPQVAAIKIADQMAGPFPLVIGAESVVQVDENVEALARILPQVDELISLMEPISKGCTERLLDPSLW